MTPKTKPEEIAESMISALSLKDRVEMANADDDEVEVYRVGFLAYVRGRSGVNTPMHEEAFDAFMRRLREQYKIKKGRSGAN